MVKVKINNDTNWITKKIKDWSMNSVSMTWRTKWNSLIYMQEEFQKDKTECGRKE
jgi:hypothetical protein